jgi:hypothetical protein
LRGQRLVRVGLLRVNACRWSQSMESNHPIRGYEPRPCTSTDCEILRARVRKPRLGFSLRGKCRTTGVGPVMPLARRSGSVWIRTKDFACRASTSGRAKRRCRESNPDCSCEKREYWPLYYIDMDDGRGDGVGDDLDAFALRSVALTLASSGHAARSRRELRCFAIGVAPASLP